MIFKKCVILFVIVSLCFLSGCRGPKVEGLVSVRGTVTYKGEPLDGATVCFTPKEFKTGDRLATGKTDTQGRFELRTIGEPGVLPGEYIVVVIKNEMIPGNARRSTPGRPPPMEIKSLIPKRYNDPKTSDVSVDVGKDGLRDWFLELVD